MINNRLLEKLARVSKHINIIKEDLTIIKGQPPFKPNLLDKLNKQHVTICKGSSSTFWICCYRCSKLGHQVDECSKPESQSSKNLLIEEPTGDVANPIYDDSNNSWEILCEDGGANLVI